ncbi:MAG: helix-turn-helix transcriptional regulator [Deltaproteobacteria bacterium]|nr:helix-turn-helix transcriptional regulator [Deltaproteobacteria bacterium]
MPKNTFRLNNHLVDELMARQELKRWWVAEMAGIHKTTLNRWLNGTIGGVRERHVENLAKVLQCRVGEIAEPI